MKLRMVDGMAHWDSNRLRIVAYPILANRLLLNLKSARHPATRTSASVLLFATNDEDTVSRDDLEACTELKLTDHQQGHTPLCDHEGSDTTRGGVDTITGTHTSSETPHATK